jgi:SOS-response transcriptional repressor LexA
MAKNWLDPFIKASKLNSQEDLADEMGVSRATINRLANDHSKLKRERAEEMAKLLGASVEALMLNRPPRAPKLSLVSSFDPDSPDSDGTVDESASYSRDHWQPAVDGAIPEIDMKLGAGSGVVGEVINLPVASGSISGHRVVAEWLIPLEYLRNEAKASPKDTLISEIIGDSMSPTYMPGDRVMIDLNQNRMTTDTVYAISDGITEPQIKRLQRIPFSDPQQVIIISDNPNLERFTVDLERITIIGRIVGHIARK